jgi:hypothetical protein
MGGKDAWFIGVKYDGLEVGGGLFTPGPMTEGIVGVVVGVGLGVSGCISPVSRDKGWDVIFPFARYI